jgi:hypothetical protein
MPDARERSVTYSSPRGHGNQGDDGSGFSNLAENQNQSANQFYVLYKT